MQSPMFFFYSLYNLHVLAPEERRAAARHDLVFLSFEGRSVNPNAVADIEIREPLRSWLGARAEVEQEASDSE